MKDWQNFKYSLDQADNSTHSCWECKKRDHEMQGSAPALPCAGKIILQNQVWETIHTSQPRLAKSNCVFNRLHIYRCFIHTLQSTQEQNFTPYLPASGNLFLSFYSTHLYPNFTLYSEIFKKNKGHRGCCYFFFQQQ